MVSQLSPSTPVEYHHQLTSTRDKRRSKSNIYSALVNAGGFAQRIMKTSKLIVKK